MSCAIQTTLRARHRLHHARDQGEHGAADHREDRTDPRRRAARCTSAAAPPPPRARSSTPTARCWRTARPPASSSRCRRAPENVTPAASGNAVPETRGRERHQTGAADDAFAIDLLGALARDVVERVVPGFAVGGSCHPFLAEAPGGRESRGPSCLDVAVELAPVRQGSGCRRRRPCAFIMVRRTSSSCRRRRRPLEGLHGRIDLGDPRRARGRKPSRAQHRQPEHASRVSWGWTGVERARESLPSKSATLRTRSGPHLWRSSHIIVKGLAWLPFNACRSMIVARDALGLGDLLVFDRRLQHHAVARSRRRCRAGSPARASGGAG